MPVNSDILVAMDVNGEPTLFAVIDPAELATEERTVYRVTSGKPFEPSIANNVYVGSFTVANYGIVYHYYAELVAPVLGEANDNEG